jgi:hypothetical protein
MIFSEKKCKKNYNPTLIVGFFMCIFVKNLNIMNTFKVTVYWNEGAAPPLKTTIRANTAKDAQDIAEATYTGGKVVIT